MNKIRELELQRKNIDTINGWCKENACDNTVSIKNAFEWEEITYNASISKNGIVVVSADGASFPVYDDDIVTSNLKNTPAGKGLIVNWAYVRQKILRAVDNEKRYDRLMENFSVDVLPSD